MPPRSRNSFRSAVFECCFGSRSRAGKQSKAKGAASAPGGFDWAAIFVPQDPEASLKRLEEKGGVPAVLRGLGLAEAPEEAAAAGIPEAEVASRKERYGANELPPSPIKSWWRLLFKSLKSVTLIALLIAGGVALGTGLVDNTDEGWADGAAIILAVCIVASVTATSDYRKQLAFRALEEKTHSNASYRVIRDGGSEASVQVGDVVVGDIVILESGMELPADGLLLTTTAGDEGNGGNEGGNEGSTIRVSEASLTGESDDVKKDTRRRPFLLAGSLVTRGHGRYVATAVGLKSFQGQVLVASSGQAETTTPLQRKLERLARSIGIVGIGFAVATFATLVIIKATAEEGSEAKAKPWVGAVIDAFIFAVSILVVAIPEGLPLAVTMSLAFAGNAMLRDNNLVRHLDACEVIGNATDICTDKTGTLTENRMKVVEVWLGGESAVAARNEAGSEHGAVGTRYTLAEAEGEKGDDDDSKDAGAPTRTKRRPPSMGEPLLMPASAPEASRPAPSSIIARNDSVAASQLPPQAKQLLVLHLSLNSTAGLCRQRPNEGDRHGYEGHSMETEGAKRSKRQNNNESTSEDENEGELVAKGSKTEGAGLLLVEAMMTTMSKPKGRPATFAYEQTRRRCIGDKGGQEQVASDAASQVSVGADTYPSASPPGGEAAPAQQSEQPPRATVKRQFAFSSDRKRMSTVVALGRGKRRLFVTGASEMVLSLCSSVVLDLSADPPRATPLDDQQRRHIADHVIGSMANDSLRTLALAYRDLRDDASSDADSLERELTLYAVLGIKDPLRRGVGAAVMAAQGAGIKVRMCSGDNKLTASAIARECGILRDENDIVMEGPVFRTMTPAQLDMILPRLAVLARSSPNDKMLLVQRLNGSGLPTNKQEWEAQHGIEAAAPTNSSSSSSGLTWEKDRDRILPGYRQEWEEARRVRIGNGKGKEGLAVAVVATTGDGSNDAPSLKAADVGLALGIVGTDVAKQASDIIITDDNFASIVNSLTWGRAVYDGIRAFLQFQLTVNIVALLLTFIAAALKRPPPLEPVQMLWVNLIMDSLGALALSTQAPSKDLLDRKPFSATASLISRKMWRHILLVAAVQLAILLFLLEGSRIILGIDEDFIAAHGGPATGLPLSKAARRYTSTLVFNALVSLQLGNELNSRSLDDHWGKVFRGLWRDKLFVAVLLFSAGVQAVIVEFGGEFTKTMPLTPFHWLLTVGIGATMLPVGLAVRKLVRVRERASDDASVWTAAFEAKMQQRLEEALLGQGTDGGLPREVLEQLQKAMDKTVVPIDAAASEPATVDALARPSSRLPNAASSKWATDSSGQDHPHLPLLSAPGGELHEVSAGTNFTAKPPQKVAPDASLSPAPVAITLLPA